MSEDLHRAMAELGHVVPIVAIAAVLMYALGVLTAALRWQRILHSLGDGTRPRVKLRDALLTHLSSIFVNNVTPGRVGGDIYRIAMLRRRTGLDTAQIAASVGYDRLSDIVPIVLLIALSFPTLYEVLIVKGGRVGLLIGGLIGMLLLGAGLFFVTRLARVRNWLAEWRQRLTAIRMSRRNFAVAIGYAFLLWGQDLLRLFLCAAALHVWLNPWQVIPLSMVAMLGGLFPTVGGLGAIEGGLTAALCLFDVGLDKAMAITALERGISYVLATSVGGLVLLCIGGGELWRRSRKGDSHDLA